MKRLGSAGLLATAIALSVCCVMAWRSGVFDASGWKAPGSGQVLRFVIGATILAAALYFVPRGWARIGVVGGFLLTAVASAGIGPVAAVLFLVASATALGGWVVPLDGFRHARAPVDTPRPLFGLIAQFLTGAALLTCLATLILPLPINTRLVWGLFLVVPFLLNRRAWSLGTRVLGEWRNAPIRGLWTTFAFAGIATLMLFGQLLVALLPEIGFDALAYHLMVPHHVETHGSWSHDFRSFAWALMPMGAESLWTPVHLLGGEQAIRLTNYVSFLAILGTLFALTQAFASRAWAWIAVALFASAPLAVLEMVSLFVENTLASYLLAAFALLTLHGRALSGRGFAAVAILLGGALATKLLAVFTIAPLGLWLAWLLWRRHGAQRGLVLAMACGLLMAVIGGVPYLRAWIETGNPVYPFFNTVFQSEHWAYGDVSNRSWQGNLSWDLPWQTVVHTSRFLTAAPGGFGFQYLVLLPFVIASLWPGPRQPRGALVATSVLMVSFFGIFYFQQYLRYIYPVLGFLTFLFVVGGARIARSSWSRRVAFTLILATVAGNGALFPAACSWLRAAPFDAVFSHSARQELTRLRMPTRVLIEHINTTHGPHARVGILPPAVGAGLEGQALYHSWHNPTFQRGNLHAKTMDDLIRHATTFRVSHFIAGHRSYGNHELMEQFLDRHARPVLALGSATLYETRPYIAHGKERLTNPHFASGAKGWTPFGSPAPTFDIARGVVPLASKQHLAQRSPLGTLGSCRITIRARGLGAPTTGLLSLGWFDEAGTLLEHTHRPVAFGQVIRTAQYRFDPPTGAQSVNVRFTPIGTETIEVDTISFRH